MDPPSGLRSLFTGSPADADDTRRVIEKKMQERREELQRLAEEYDRERTRLQCEIQKLKVEYNSFAPVTRIPPEILDLIFEEYVADVMSDYEVMREYDGCLPPYRWFRILHVCREWRRVAFSAKHLWNWIVPTNSHCVDLALSSSGQLPLKIKLPRRMRQGEASPTTAYRLIFRELWRVQSAQWRVTDPLCYHLARWATGSGFAAPILKHLFLDIHVHDDTIPGLSTMEMPQLTSLVMTGGSTNVLRTLVRPTLTSLRLSSLHAHARVSEYIAVLQQLPLLECLVILDHTNIDPLLLLPQAAHPTASLPHLKQVELAQGGLGIASAQLIKHLTFPTSTMVDLTFHGFATAQECSVALSFIIPKIHASDTALPNGSSSRFRPRSLHYNSYEVCLWESVRPWDMDLDFQAEGDAPRLSLYQQTHEVFVTAACLFHLLDLTELVTMRTEVALHAGEWLYLFKDLKVPKLKCLCLRGASDVVLPVLEALAARFPEQEAAQGQSSDGETPSAARSLFPDLKTVQLQCVDFRRKPGRVHADDFIVVAIELLQQRAKSGCKLDRLIIEQPINFSDEDDEMLLVASEIAGSVDVMNFGYSVDNSDDGESYYVGEEITDEDSVSTGAEEDQVA